MNATAEITTAKKTVVRWDKPKPSTSNACTVAMIADDPVVVASGTVAAIAEVEVHGTALVDAPVVDGPRALVGVHVASEHDAMEHDERLGGDIGRFRRAARLLQT